MRAGAGKSKGNAFENLVGHKLSLWLTEGADKHQFIPSRLSGGWEAATWRHAADLAPNGVVGEHFRKLIIVECKHRKEDLLWALYNPPSDRNIQGWWAKLCPEAEDIDQTPMIVFRQNSRPLMVVVPISLAYGLCNPATEEYHVGEATVIECADMGIITLKTLTRWPPEEFYSLLSLHLGGDGWDLRQNETTPTST